MRLSIFILATLFLAACQPTAKQETPATVPGTTSTTTTSTATTSTTTQTNQTSATPPATPKQDNTTVITDTIKVKGTNSKQMSTYPNRKNELNDTAAEIRKVP